MAASPAAMDTSSAQPQEKWNSDNLTPSADADASGGPSSDNVVPPAHGSSDYAQGGSGDRAASGAPSANDDAYRGEKQVKVLIWSLFVSYVL